MPEPVSETVSRTYAPGRASKWLAAYSSSIQTFEVSIVSRPPFGIASRALTARLTMICSTCPGSKQMGVTSLPQIV